MDSRLLSETHRCPEDVLPESRASRTLPLNSRMLSRLQAQAGGPQCQSPAPATPQAHCVLESSSHACVRWAHSLELPSKHATREGLVKRAGHSPEELHPGGRGPETELAKGGHKGRLQEEATGVDGEQSGVVGDPLRLILRATCSGKCPLGACAGTGHPPRHCGVFCQLPCCPW